MFKILHEAGMTLLEWVVIIFFGIAMLPLTVAALLDDFVQKSKRDKE
jgi:Tfp pilus assembly protein PilE